MRQSTQRVAEPSVNRFVSLVRGRILTKYRQQVVREVRDADGQSMGILCEHYDGSVEDAVRVAEVISDQMYRAFPDASNIQSRIIATDETGRGKWAIAPNFYTVAEVGTEEAAYIVSGLRFTSGN